MEIADALLKIVSCSSESPLFRFLFQSVRTTPMKICVSCFILGDIRNVLKLFNLIHDVQYGMLSVSDSVFGGSLRVFDNIPIDDICCIYGVDGYI